MGKLQAAYVLHTRSYRETSLLVELLTIESGRFSVLAKGVKTSKFSLKGLLQPFVPLMVSWRGRGELPTLRSVEAGGEPHHFRSHQLVSALYLNELLMRLLHRNDPCTSIFEIYKETLKAISVKEPHAIALRIFEKYLLQKLGYGLHLTHAADTHKPILEDRCYQFSSDRGFIASQCSLEKGNLFSGKTILAIAKDDYQDNNILRDAKRLMRLAFLPLLDGKPIKTRELLIT